MVCSLQMLAGAMLTRTVITGLKDGLNVGADFATGVGLLALMAPSNPLATSFNMDDLDRHNVRYAETDQ